MIWANSWVLHMGEITITADIMQYISLFEKLTGVVVKDCLEADDHIIFIVAEGQGSMAIGKKGEKVERFRQMTRRKIRVIEFAPTPEQFLMNIFRTYEPVRVEISTKRKGVLHATVFVPPENKARAIGKEGKNLRVARELVMRHFPVQSVSVSEA